MTSLLLFLLTAVLLTAVLGIVIGCTLPRGQRSPWLVGGAGLVTFVAQWTSVLVLHDAIGS